MTMVYNLVGLEGGSPRVLKTLNNSLQLEYRVAWQHPHDASTYTCE